MNPVIALRAASKAYQSGDNIVVALHPVDLDIHPGQVIGIIGPSGSGKTTLLTLAGMIDAPSSGRVYFMGHVLDASTSLETLADLRRRHVGFVFQKPNLIPFLNAIENVQIALHVNGQPEAAARGRAQELLDHLGLERRHDHMPTQLSGGEQQRVAIARALANHPQVLIADEPTAALDPIRSQQVIEMFRQLAHVSGVAVVVVTHDTRSTHMFDDVVELLDGAICARWSSGHGA